MSVNTYWLEISEIMCDLLGNGYGYTIAIFDKAHINVERQAAVEALEVVRDCLNDRQYKLLRCYIGVYSNDPL